MADGKGKSGEPTGDNSVPKAVVSRLSLYLRELQHLMRDGQETTSSTQLGKLLGFTDAQVRKDLAYFGQFGYPGIGYRCDELVAAIKRILGTNREWNVALVGIGNLGRALLGYRGFGEQGFRVAAAFDVDPNKVGSVIDGVPVYAIADMSAIVKEKGIRLAIIAVPAVAAQVVADEVVKSGVDGVLNFAPVTISLPKEVSTVGVDLAIELEQLSFSVASKHRKQEEPPAEA
ncbi:MAG TPA: redox-sensing transcriptional repressor Rex [Pirellulaceae bacterium]|nr:redox-sensing transcriptional repressor Rex [Pirellulaceae bacterium]